MNTNSSLRIVCLVPSITALLHHLGVEEHIVGITKFCVDPPHLLKTKTIVGGTKNVHIQKVLATQPTLIIANKEENVKSQIQILSHLYTTIVTDVYNLDTALAMIATIGKAVKKTAKANALIKQIKQSWLSLPIVSKPITCCYLIWKKPFISIGGDTYINSVLQAMGLQNIFTSYMRYPIANTNEIIALQPQVILLSSEPYPFKQKHVQQLQLLFPEIPILLINGQICSWYGSHILQIAKYATEVSSQLLMAIKK